MDHDSLIEEGELRYQELQKERERAWTTMQQDITMKDQVQQPSTQQNVALSQGNPSFWKWADSTDTNPLPEWQTTKKQKAPLTKTPAELREEDAVRLMRAKFNAVTVDDGPMLEYDLEKRAVHLLGLQQLYSHGVVNRFDEPIRPNGTSVPARSAADRAIHKWAASYEMETSDEEEESDSQWRAVYDKKTARVLLKKGGHSRKMLARARQKKMVDHQYNAKQKYGAPTLVQQPLSRKAHMALQARINHKANMQTKLWRKLQPIERAASAKDATPGSASRHAADNDSSNVGPLLQNASGDRTQSINDFTGEAVASLNIATPNIHPQAVYPSIRDTNIAGLEPPTFASSELGNNIPAAETSYTAEEWPNTTNTPLASNPSLATGTHAMISGTSNVPITRDATVATNLPPISSTRHINDAGTYANQFGLSPPSRPGGDTADTPTAFIATAGHWTESNSIIHRQPYQMSFRHDQVTDRKASIGVAAGIGAIHKSNGTSGTPPSTLRTDADTTSVPNIPRGLKISDLLNPAIPDRSRGANSQTDPGARPAVDRPYVHESGTTREDPATQSNAGVQSETQRESDVQETGSRKHKGKREINRTARGTFARKPVD